METPLLDPVLPVEGRHVLHLFFRVDYAAWDMLEGSQRIAAKTALASLVQEIRATPATQLLTFSIVSPKADLGFMLLTPRSAHGGQPTPSSSRLRLDLEF